MIKVCLVYPECYDVAKFGTKRKEFPPFGVMYLASSLEQHRINVQIIKTSQNHFVLDFSEFDLDIVAIGEGEKNICDIVDHLYDQPSL